MINTINGVKATNTGKMTDVIFSITDGDYKLNLILLLLIANIFNTNDLYTIQSCYADDKIIILNHSRFTINYDSGNGLIFRLNADDKTIARQTINKILDLAITKDNFKQLELQLVDIVYNRVFAKANGLYGIDKILYQYNDIICSRQMLIKLFRVLGFRDEVKKATRYLKISNIDTVRFSTMHKYKIQLKDLLKSV